MIRTTQWISAGAVISTQFHGTTYVLLLLHQAGHWDFAKGHVEQDELLSQAAKREACEETGLEIVLNERIKTTFDYWYHETGGTGQQNRVHKTVTLFAATPLHQNEQKIPAVLISDEHRGYGWFTIDEAIKTITYPEALKALQIISQTIATQTTRHTS